MNRFTMEFKQAERRFRVVCAQYRAGELDEDRFRFEVAKLTLRDSHGVLWMLDPDQETWYYNDGEGWRPGDPHAAPGMQPEADADRVPAQRRRRRLLALILVFISLLAIAGALVLRQGFPRLARDALQATPVQAAEVEVTIASPADGTQVSLGQEIAIEFAITARPSLQEVDRVVLAVDGQAVSAQSIEARGQRGFGPGQIMLPLSQLWRPETAGEHEITATAFSSDNQALSSAAITVAVVEPPEEAVREPACIPDATFVTDVTIPPGTVFPPGVRMDKVWEVRNSGSCAWGGGYRLVQLGEGSWIAPDAVAVPPTAAGDTVDLAVTLWAPSEAGVYTSTWQLSSPEGEPFGPALLLSIIVQALAPEDLPPSAPRDLVATVAQEAGKPATVGLTWSDQSDNEDAFRVYRADLEGSIGLVPASTERFVDEEVTCGNTYQYWVAALNAAGTSVDSNTASVSLPPCAPANGPPALNLTVVPTQVRATRPFTLAFNARDDLGLELVVVWGIETEDAALDEGRVFTCTTAICNGTWPLAWEEETTTTLRLVAVALDSSGQRSEPSWLTITVLPPRVITTESLITEEE